MSDHKNYSTKGISSDVQFGKGGGRITFADGCFKLAAPTGDALATLKVATPVNSDEAVPLAMMTAAIDAANAKIDTNTSLLQTQIATVQTAIQNAQASVIGGSVKAAIGSFVEANGTAAVLTVPAATLLRLKVLIVTAFASGATIALKTSKLTLATETTIDEVQPGVYIVELLDDTEADTVSVEITTTGTSGTAAVSLEYIAKS